MDCRVEDGLEGGKPGGQEMSPEPGRDEGGCTRAACAPSALCTLPDEPSSGSIQMCSISGG